MSEEDIRTIAENVKKYRLLNHMTQEELAEKLDMDTQYYAQIERGERRFTLEKIIKVCRVLNVNIQDIVDISQTQRDVSYETKKHIIEFLDNATENQIFLIDKFINEIIIYIRQRILKIYFVWYDIKYMPINVYSLFLQLQHYK